MSAAHLVLACIPRRPAPRLAGAILFTATTLVSVPAPAGPPAQPADAPADATLAEIDLDRPLSAPPAAPLPEGRKLAAQLYNEATAEWKNGRERNAFRLFRLSYEQDGAPEALANLAVLEGRFGRPRAAAEHLALAIERLPPEYANRADNLRERLAQMAKQVGVLKVRIETEGELYIDGHWNGQGPLARTVYVDPGAHVASLQGSHFRIERKIDIGKGEERELIVTRPEVDAVVAQRRAEAAMRALAAAPKPAGPSTAVVAGTLGAAGAFAALGGVGIGVLARAAGERAKIESDVKRFGGACPASSPGFADDCRARDQEAANETAGIALAATGFGFAAAAGLGTLLYISLTPPAQPSAAMAAVQLVPLWNFGGLGSRSPSPLPAPSGLLFQGTF